MERGAEQVAAPGRKGARRIGSSSKRNENESGSKNENEGKERYVVDAGDGEHGSGKSRASGTPLFHKQRVVICYAELRYSIQDRSIAGLNAHRHHQRNENLFCPFLFL